MKEVFVRKPMLHGKQTKLVRAQVLSETADTVRIKVPEERVPRDVKRADVIESAEARFDRRDGHTLIQKSYPQSLTALVNRFKES